MQENIRQRALKLFQQGHHNKARNLYEKMCKKNPHDAEAIYMLGSIYGQTGEYILASRYFKRTLKLQPKAFVAICGLGAAYKGLGQYDDAEKTFQQALKLQPGNTELLQELAGVYLLQGKVNEAESTLRKILTKTPSSVDALHGLGEVLHSRQQLDLAESYYKQALEIQPERADTHNRLGYIKHTKGFLEDALYHYKKAISVQPNVPDFWKNLSQTQLLYGQTDEAIDSIDHAIKIKPGDINTITIKASIYERTGNAESAYEIIKPFLKKKVLHTGIARIYISICRKLGHCDEAIDYLDMILAQRDIPASMLESIHYEAGKLFDKLGDYDKAFRHFEAANNSRPSQYQPAEHSAYVDAIISVFDWSFLSTAPRSLAYDRELPVLIVGMPRSGTSLLEQILDSHADITGAGELTDIENISAGIVHSIDPDKSTLHSYRNISIDMLELYAKKYLDKLSSISPESRYITDKMPQNFFHLGLISMMLPKAKIIHCVRNPVDTCLSIYFQHFNESHEYATRFEDIVHYYKEYRRLMDHWKTVLQLPIHEINYDELVNSPKHQIRDLLDFLEVEWDDNCLKFHKSKRQVATASYEQVTQSLYTSSQGRWTNYENHVTPLLESLSSFHQETNYK